MSLSRKHFNKLAEIVDLMGDSITDEAQAYLAECLADFCECENPLFDRERFLQACGVNA